MTAPEILAKHLFHMTGMIRHQMGHVAIDTEELTRCIEAVMRERTPEMADSISGQVTISALAARLYLERNHIRVSELTIVTFQPQTFGPVTLAPGKWQLRRVG